MAENSVNEAELREIFASEILDKIQKGEPVEYDHVRITGELDLSKLDLLRNMLLERKIRPKTKSCRKNRGCYLLL